MYLWMDDPIRKQNTQARGFNINVHGIESEKSMVIPQDAKPHLVKYMVMQIKDLDDQRLYRNIDKY